MNYGCVVVHVYYNVTCSQWPIGSKGDWSCDDISAGSSGSVAGAVAAMEAGHVADLARRERSRGRTTCVRQELSKMSSTVSVSAQSITAGARQSTTVGFGNPGAKRVRNSGGQLCMPVRVTTQPDMQSSLRKKKRCCILHVRYNGACRLSHNTKILKVYLYAGRFKDGKIEIFFLNNNSIHLLSSIKNSIPLSESQNS